MLARLGQLVTSRAGRDQGSHFIIVDKINEKYLLIADGNSHKIEKPKKKNIVHLIIHRDIIEDIAEKLVNNEPVTNREIKRALLKWK